MKRFKRFFSFIQKGADESDGNVSAAQRTAESKQKNVNRNDTTTSTRADPNGSMTDTEQSRVKVSLKPSSSEKSHVNLVSFVKKSSAESSRENVVGAKPSQKGTTEAKPLKKGSMEKSQKEPPLVTGTEGSLRENPTEQGTPAINGNNGEASAAKSFISAVDESGGKSFRRLRTFSERAVRRVKTFVSRPIKQSSLQRFITKLEAKREAEESGRIAELELKRGDDVFPKPIRRSKSIESKEKCTEQKDPDNVDVKSVAQMFTMSTTGGQLPSGCKLVHGNKDNGGKLFDDNNQPFWTEQAKPTEADLADSNTEDDLQMNAEVAVDVCDGKVTLVNMPTIPVILDPMNELAELKRRDKFFYTRDVLFGNSVRTMINLCESVNKPTPIQRAPKGEMVTFKEPRSRYTYEASAENRECPANAEQLPFRPGNAQSSFRRLRRRTSMKSSRLWNLIKKVGDKQCSQDPNGVNECKEEKTQPDDGGQMGMDAANRERSPPNAQLTPT
ncbi:hypothetical protein GCK32_002133 [Trichostrongylus colubriformis]|uniref:Uncharacterized protein n=1 Tax=Trichostrongylus colubriformis TaxID=6319 RepID=A0AAN8IAJ5_TRICO